MDNKKVDTQEKAPVLTGEGLFQWPLSPDEKPYLIGNKCRSCGESFFPSRTLCRNCSGEDLEEIHFGQTGKLYSFTTFRVRPPHSIVPMPYMAGIVELEEGEKVRTLLAVDDQSLLEIGMDMELVIESIGKTVVPTENIEVGTDIIGWKFRPVRRKQE